MKEEKVQQTLGTTVVGINYITATVTAKFSVQAFIRYERLKDNPHPNIDLAARLKKLSKEELCKVLLFSLECDAEDEPAAIVKEFLNIFKDSNNCISITSPVLVNDDDYIEDNLTPKGLEGVIRI